MASFRLYKILAFFAIIMQVSFLRWADHHIVSNSNAPVHGKVLPSGDKLSQTRKQPMRDAATASDRVYVPEYTKFDTSHPPILFASSPGSLPSLPDANRIPHNVLMKRNFTEHFSNWDPATSPHALFVYNPSIVSLHHPATRKDVRYLSTFRVSSIHSCGFPTYEFWKYPKDYLALALLDSDLKIASIDGESLDIVVDINQHLPRIYHRRLKVQDVRLFTLHDRVFLSSGKLLVPICIKVGGVDTDNALNQIPAICDDRRDAVAEELPALYRKNSRLHLYVTGNAIEMKDTDGKNFQFFGQSLSQTTSVMMEYWPHGPRLVHDLGDGIARVYSNESSRQQKKVVSVMRKSEHESKFSPDPLSYASVSLDSSLKTFIKRDRSSACCVQIAKAVYADLIPHLPKSAASKLKHLDYVMVGVSHSKSRGRMPSSQGDRYNYLSRLYAFSTGGPYELIARSGLFCFGFTDEKDARLQQNIGVGNEYSDFTMTKTLELYGSKYNCPNIHFVVSIIEKEEDGDQLIISYGVNDCVPRFMVLSKRDVMIHLFSGNSSSVVS